MVQFYRQESSGIEFCKTEKATEEILKKENYYEFSYYI